MSAAEIIAELPRLSPDDLAKVRASIDALTVAAPAVLLAAHPAIGLWKDRTDLPADSVAASERLRGRLVGHDGAGCQDLVLRVLPDEDKIRSTESWHPAVEAVKSA